MKEQLYLFFLGWIPKWLQQRELPEDLSDDNLTGAATCSHQETYTSLSLFKGKIEIFSGSHCPFLNSTTRKLSDIIIGRKIVGR